jgi:hypothetical protein
LGLAEDEDNSTCATCVYQVTKLQNFFVIFVHLNWIQYPWKVFSAQPVAIDKYQLPGDSMDYRQFCNFHLVKNSKIGKNSIQRKISTDLKSFEFYNYFGGAWTKLT